MSENKAPQISTARDKSLTLASAEKFFAITQEVLRDARKTRIDENWFRTALEWAMRQGVPDTHPVEGTFRYLKGFPRKIEELWETSELYLNDCGIQWFPAFLCDLYWLKKLDLSNFFSSPGDRLVWEHRTIFPDPADWNAFGCMRWADVGRNQLQWNPKIGKISSLPMEIDQLEALEELVLENCELTSLPLQVGSLKRLKRLSLGCNNIAFLPETIGKLSMLEELCLFKNALSSLPRCLGSLRNLKKLHLHCNQIKEIPDSIGDLESLEELILSANLLEELPCSFSKLTNLKRLDVSGNKLQRIPQGICELKGLSVLRIDENPASTLPETITRLEGVKFLIHSINYWDLTPVQRDWLSKIPRAIKSYQSKLLLPRLSVNTDLSTEDHLFLLSLLAKKLD